MEKRKTRLNRSIARVGNGIKKINRENVKKGFDNAKRVGKAGTDKVRSGVKKGTEQFKKGVNTAKRVSNAGKEQIKKGIANAGKKVQLIKPILLVDGVTLSNAMFGLLSIFASIRGSLKIAAYFILIAAVMDILDGKFARKLGRTTELGKELDSLADIVSFGVAPAVLGYVYVGDIRIIIPAIIFLSCGIIRLAKFNTQFLKNAYFGMPITCNSLIFATLYFAGASAVYWFIAYIISAALMVSPFKLKKIL